MRSFAIIALGALALVVMVYQLTIAAKEDSATWDEPVYLAAGYTYVHTNDYRQNPEHPPLIKDLAGLAVSTLDVNYPFDRFYANGNDIFSGPDFLYKNGNDADAILLRGRLVVIAIAIILGVFVFIWSSELYGLAAGLFSLILYAFDPNILAHGHLVTHDFPVAAAFLINLYFVTRFMKKPSIPTLVLSGITLGIALTIRYSALALLPIYVLLFIYAGVKHMIDQKQEDAVLSMADLASAGKRIAFYCGSFFAVLSVAAALVFAVYSFNTARMPNDTQQDLFEQLVSQNSLIAKPIRFALRENIKPVAQYLIGLGKILGHTNTGSYVYFAGDASMGQRYFYYPLVLLIKSTIPAILLILMAITLMGRAKPTNPIAEFGILIAAAVVFASNTSSMINGGIRYLLPLYPLLYVYAGKLVKIVDPKAIVDSLKARRCPASAALCTAIVALLVWHIAGTVRISPYYLSYFNEIVGEDTGKYIVVDSNLDWGQDLKRLKAYVEKKGIEKIYVNHFGLFGGVDYYLGKKGTDWLFDLKKPHGWVAVSYSRYIPASVSGQHRWFFELEPVDKVGTTFLIFKVP